MNLIKRLENIESKINIKKDEFIIDIYPPARRGQQTRAAVTRRMTGEEMKVLNQLFNRPYIKIENDIILNLGG